MKTKEKQEHPKTRRPYKVKGVLMRLLKKRRGNEGDKGKAREEAHEYNVK